MEGQHHQTSKRLLFQSIEIYIEYKEYKIYIEYIEFKLKKIFPC